MLTLVLGFCARVCFFRLRCHGFGDCWRASLLPFGKRPPPPGRQGSTCAAGCRCFLFFLLASFCLFCLFVLVQACFACFCVLRVGCHSQSKLLGHLTGSVHPGPSLAARKRKLFSACICLAACCLSVLSVLSVWLICAAPYSCGGGTCPSCAGAADPGSLPAVPRF